MKNPRWSFRFELNRLRGSGRVENASTGNYLLIGYVALALISSGCAVRRTFVAGVPAPQWTDFSDAVHAYSELVDGIEKKLPPLPAQATPVEIASHKAALASAVRQARHGARQGTIFTSSIRQRFVSVIRSEVRGRSGKAARETLKEDNPGAKRVTLAANAVYPDSAPLSSVPPTLLLRLPTLPPTLEYRFVGRSLVLHDVRANIIVDFIRNALP